MNRNSAPSLTGKKRALTVESEPEFKIMYMNSVKVYTPPGIDLYPSQKRMINWVLRAVQESKNALIESPTGSGKTLGLLASVCSWLTKYEDQRRKKKSCPVHGVHFTENTANEEETANETELFDASTSKLEDEMPAEKNVKLDETLNEADNLIKTVAEACTCMPKVRIYYCTRTHKQIYQVVNEYKRLPFAQMGTLKHTILASREQSCVNQDVRDTPGDLNTNCKKVLEPKGLGCVYRDALKEVTTGRVRSTIRNKLNDKDLNVWNIDELVNKLSKIKMKVCPYFLTNRELTKDANLIFCPFNYLLDPIVRESSDVYLKNSIIILDEAHNIEDVCRNAASFEFTDLEFVIALHNLRSKFDDLEKQTRSMRAEGYVGEELEFFENYRTCIKKWHDYLNRLFTKFKVLITETENIQPDKYSNTRTLNIASERLTTWLSDVYLAANGDEYSEYKHAFNQLAMKTDPVEKTISDLLAKLNLQLNTQTIVLMEKFLFFYKFHSHRENRLCYKGNVEISPVKMSSAEQSQHSDSHALKGLVPGNTVKLGFWSMLPLVAFDDAFSECRSIILASGTLCPLDTFCGELGVKFDYQMEGEQIIPAKQIFCAALGTGPTKKNLRLTFANMQNAIPDLATIILDVCSICPGGVLVFVSSYRVLQQIKESFYNSGNIKKLQAIKEVFYEPRDSRDMTKLLKDYEKAIARPRMKCTGAVMFAVFRGKVSEGLNFEDDKARAVISIGIPYPNVGDQQVQQKRSFNDQNAKKCNLLVGAEWYEIQAFRAINQALGRCLRHKNDWGALIAIDERYTPTQTKISGWVRAQMRNNMDYQQFCKDLGEFVTYHVNNPAVKMEPEMIEDNEF